MRELINKVCFAQWFCLFIVILCIAYFWWLSWMGFYHNTPTDISEIKICLIGICGSCVGYIVGSSQSSKSKDDVIKSALDKTNQP